MGGQDINESQDSLGNIKTKAHTIQHAATSTVDHTFPSGTTTFLRADGTFAEPPASTASGTPSGTVVSETTYGAASAAGTSAEYSRGDHTHGSVADLVTGTAHASLTTGVHSLGTMALAASADYFLVTASTTHAAAASGVHGAGTANIATTSDIATHAALTTAHSMGTMALAASASYALTTTYAAHTVGSNMHGAGTIAGLADIVTHAALTTGAHGSGTSAIEITSRKAAANGYASLDASSLVVQNPASAATAAASAKIAVAGSDGKLDTWLTGGSFISASVLTAATGQYTVPTGGTKIWVRLQGGGGGGGGATGAASSAAIGGGGGAGGYAEKIGTVVAGSSYAYTCGVGGAGGAAANSTGVAGSATVMVVGATTVTAAGGSGGIGSSVAASTGVSVLGGAGAVVSTNGDVNAAGQHGGYAIRITGALAVSGGGGYSFFGGGGNSRNTAGAGNIAVAFGAGGGGAMSVSATGQVGGNGGNGLIIVWAFTK